MGMVAEVERKFIRERQQAGVEAAEAKGIYKDRKPSVSMEKVREMRANGHGASAHCQGSRDQPDARAARSYGSARLRRGRLMAVSEISCVWVGRLILFRPWLV